MALALARLEPTATWLARRIRRDGDGRGELRRRLPLPAPSSRAGGPTPTPTRWAGPWSRRPRKAGLRMTLLDTCYLAGGLAPAWNHHGMLPLARRS